MLSCISKNGWHAVLFGVVIFFLSNSVEKSCGFVQPSISKQTKTTTAKIWMSTVVDRPKTKETQKVVEILKDRDTFSEEKNGKDSWEIRLFNDPINHRTFVAKCLCCICGKSDGESYQIMMQAHRNGMGVVGRYPYEIAEMYHDSLKEEGLTVDMVQVDDE